MICFQRLMLVWALFSASCALHKERPLPTYTEAEMELRYKPAPWTNPYEGDPELAGVAIGQLGENPYGQDQYVGKHPEMIIYYFWDGRVRQQNYRPDGAVYSDQWWPEKLKAGEPGWDSVDFSFGSDPTFKNHTDPRPVRSQVTNGSGSGAS